SVAGFYAEGFARLFPHRTRALLLLDSSVASDRAARFTLPLAAKLVAADAGARLLNGLHLQAPLGRVGLALMHRRRPGGLDDKSRAEIRCAAAEPGFPAALFSELVVYHELETELCALRDTSPLPPVRRMVVTAHTGWRTHRWRAQQIQMAELLDAEHVTIAPAGHLVMIDQPDRTADLIRAIGSDS